MTNGGKITGDGRIYCCLLLKGFFIVLMMLLCIFACINIIIIAEILLYNRRFVQFVKMHRIVIKSREIQIIEYNQ